MLKLYSIPCEETVVYTHTCYIWAEDEDDLVEQLNNVRANDDDSLEVFIDKAKNAGFERVDRDVREEITGIDFDCDRIYLEEAVEEWP